jgi:hypothetical protein
MTIICVLTSDIQYLDIYVISSAKNFTPLGYLLGQCTIRIMYKKHPILLYRKWIKNIIL